jgi:hypothetical protein
MIDSCSVTKKTAQESSDLMAIRIEAFVERRYLPWIGRKIRKASQKGKNGVMVNLCSWFKGEDFDRRALALLEKRLMSLGYSVVTWADLDMKVGWA